MKKNVFLVSFFLLAFCVLHAQEKSSKRFAEISLGPSFPIGQFGEKSYNDNEKDQPGLAQPGIATNATFGFHIKENVGWLLTVGYNLNKQKPEGLEEYIAGYYYPAGADVDVTTKSWKILKVMAGGFLITPLTEDKLNLVTKLSAGICSAIIPEYSWHAKNVGTSYANGGVGKVRLPVTFCYQISLGLQYKMNKKAYLLFDINSFNATATNKGGQTSGGQLPDRKCKMGSVNALVGVGFNF
jgi:hypothetical protein